MHQRVVVLSAFFHPYTSGAEACAEQVSARLSSQFDITVVTCRMRKDLPRQELIGGVRVLRIGRGSSLDPWLFPFLAAAKVRQLKPEIVHAILETFAGLALYFCRWTYPKAKRILTLQTTNRSFFKGPIIHSAHAVTAISSVLVRIAQKKRHRNVVRIPNGVSIVQLQQATREHEKISGQILFVGRLEPMKGVDTLLRAFALLIQESDVPGNTHLEIVGDGSQRASLETLTAELGIHDNVRFLGKLTGARLNRAYSEAEIFCGLSRSEALGNVFLEAQAAGCAVVATNVGGIPDIVLADRTGLLVAPNKPEEAMQALKKLLMDSSLRSRFIEAGKTNAARYDWDLIAPQYASVYRSVV